MGPRIAFFIAASLVGGCGGRQAESVDASVANTECTSADKTTLGWTLDGVGELAIDATDVYWVNFAYAASPPPQAITIQRNAKGGGAQELFASPCPGLDCHPTLMLDDSTVYYTGQDASGVSVNSLTKQWARSAVLATALDTTARVVGVDASNVYVASGDGISSLSKGGGPLVPVAAGADVVFLGSDDSNVYFTSTEAPGSLNVTPKSGGAASVLAVLPGVIGGFAADAENIYVGGGGSAGPLEGIYVVPKLGAAPRVLAPGFVSIAVVVDGSTLYAAGYESVVAIDLESGAVTRTAEVGVGEFGSLAVDSDTLYGALNGDHGGEILRVCRFATLP
jgi:hypothetical protein